MSRRPTPPARSDAAARPTRAAPGAADGHGRQQPRRPRRGGTPASGTSTGRRDRSAAKARPGRQPRQAVSRARDQVVSRTSAARFAARSQVRRWSWWRVVLVGLGVLALVAGAAWVVLASPLLAVREVGVVGAERVERADVVELASGAVGTPMARVEAAALEDAVASLPLVKEVDVVRAWPGTLEVRLVERVPVVAVAAPSGYRLADADGVVVAEVPAAPADLPLVRSTSIKDLASIKDFAPDGEQASATGSRGSAALAAAADVVAALPPELRADVAEITVTTPDDVRMRLRDGSEAVWGSPAESELKSRVLAALRGQDADVYDVSAPLTPVTR